MGRIVAIDLGAANSTVAIPEARSGPGFLTVDECPGCAVILDRFDRPTTPSVIAEDRNGEIIVGREAKGRPIQIQFATRYIGEDETFQLGKHGVLRAEQVYSHILHHLKKVLEERLKETADQAVIAVPGYFSIRARQLVLNAALQSGFADAGIVAAPSAVACAYSEGKPPDSARLIMIYDLGGRKFECALVDSNTDGSITLRATNSDRFLGGRKFDQSVARWLLQKLIESGYDLKADPEDSAYEQVFEKLVICAEEANQDYEMQGYTGIIDSSGVPVEFDFPISRNEFESLIIKDVDRTIELCEKMLERTTPPVRIDSLHDIVMVGGSSHIPLVAKRLEERFGSKPKLFAPDLAVALGAALFASDIERSHEPAAAANYLPKTISIWMGDKATLIADRGVPLPFQTTFEAETPGGSQELRMPVMEGDELLCVFHLKLPSQDLRNESLVKIKFTIEQNYQMRAEIYAPDQIWNVEPEYLLAQEIDSTKWMHTECERRIALMKDSLAQLIQKEPDLAKEPNISHIEEFRAAAQRAYFNQDTCALEEAFRRIPVLEDWLAGLEYAHRIAEMRRTDPAALLSWIDREIRQLGSQNHFSELEQLASVRGIDHDEMGGGSLQDYGSLRTLKQREDLIALRGQLEAQEGNRLLAKASESADQNKWDEAVDSLKRGLEIIHDPHGQRVFRESLSRCLANRAVGNVNAAVPALKSGKAEANRSELLNAVRSAERDLEEAVKLDPSSKDAAQNLQALRKVFQRKGKADVPGGRVDQVHFSVTAPSSVQPGDSFVIDVWAHLEREREKIIKMAREAFAAGEISIKSKGPAKIARGTVLTVRLRVDEVSIEEPEDLILWEGKSGNASFIVKVPTGIAIGPKAGLATIHIDGLRIARVDFILQIGAKSPVAVLPAQQQQQHRTAFVSYASVDRDRVLPRVQGIQKVDKGLKVFMDMLSLFSGQDWEQELWRVIPTSDVFYLFWSKNAKKSEWVEKEWRCALQTRGIDFIDPVPLDSPDEVPPPPELASKHFNDWVLAFISGKRLE